MFLIPRLPVMRPNMGFIELPVGSVFRDSVALLLEHATMRAANHVVDDQRKKKKDDEEKKRWSKQRAKLQRGKRRQGSSEEELEEDEGRRKMMVPCRPSYGMIWPLRMRTHLHRRRGPSRGML